VLTALGAHAAGFAAARRCLRFLVVIIFNATITITTIFCFHVTVQVVRNCCTLGRVSQKASFTDLIRLLQNEHRSIAVVNKSIKARAHLFEAGCPYYHTVSSVRALEALMMVLRRQQQPFYGHYTRHPVLANIPSQELEDFIGAEF